MATESLLFKTSLTANTGYGHDGMDLTRAMAEHGIDVRLMPMAVTPPLPMEVARLLTLPLDVDFDYLLHHVDPMQMGLSRGEQRSARKKVAWTMWEFTSFGEDASAENLAERLGGYDLLLTYDPVSAEALGPYAQEAGVKMQTLQGGYRASEWKYDTRQRDWNGVFRYGMVGALNSRKNPFAAIRAYSRLLDEGHVQPGEVELHLKTSVLGLHPDMEKHIPGLHIHYELWPKQRLMEFYAGLNMLLAPSWGEGKNLPAMEAMTMGVPVAYTDFGGHTMWGSTEYGYPIGYTLEEHEGRGMPSARIDEDALMEAMLDAFNNRTLAREKGEIASRIIPSMCDWGKVVQNLRGHLQRL
jgi:glycosyltransferase involved in cell wall biosynthesis